MPAFKVVVTANVWKKFPVGSVTPVEGGTAGPESGQMQAEIMIYDGTLVAKDANAAVFAAGADCAFEPKELSQFAGNMNIRVASV